MSDLPIRTFQLPPEQQAIRDRCFHPSGTFVEFPEKELTQIWGEVLSVGGVGIHDNFFELGGHSLAAMRVVARVLQTIQLDLALQALFDAPTVAAMAQAIAERQGQRIKQEDLERLLAEVEAMTEAEAQSQIAGKV